MLGLASCGGGGASTPADPTPADPTPLATSSTVAAPPPDGVVPEGFPTTAARVTTVDGDVCDLCLWVAADDERRGRGLMGVTDLGGPDGMAFVYERPRTTSFTMRNTLLPLTLVFFGADGEYLEAFDMEPCEAEPCPPYPTPQGFTVAVEVEQGAAAELALVEGSVLELLARDCETPPSH
jgi:uncharacterized protein